MTPSINLNPDNFNDGADLAALKADLVADFAAAGVEVDVTISDRKGDGLFGFEDYEAALTIYKAVCDRCNF